MSDILLYVNNTKKCIAEIVRRRNVWVYSQTVFVYRTSNFTQFVLTALYILFTYTYRVYKIFIPEKNFITVGEMKKNVAVFNSRNMLLKVIGEIMKFHWDVDVINRKGKIKSAPMFN